MPRLSSSDRVAGRPPSIERRGPRLTHARTLALLLAAGSLIEATADYFVDPGGSDAAAGTQTAPFATPERARDAIRADRVLSGTNTPDEVWLGGGDYIRTNTFLLTAADSYTRYRARPGQTPVFLGGQRLSGGDFSPVTTDSPSWNRLDDAATGQVYQLDLASAGLTDYGTLRPRGYATVTAAPMELQLNGRPETLARWPNSGTFAYTGSALSETNFTYTGTRPERWSQASDIWIHGFFQWLWADFARAVDHIDTTNKTIWLSSAPGSFGITSNRPYYVFNLLEELDTPGEYTIDRSSGMLYYWPPEDLAAADLTLSVMESPLLAMSGASSVSVEDITFEGARGELVRINDGSDSRIYNCRLLGAGDTAADVSGFRNGIERCDILDAGGSGVWLTGGIATSNELVRGDNFVRQCDIARFGRLTLTYTGGIKLSGGMGNSVEHCRIHDSAHMAVYLRGNDHSIEYNEIFHVLQYSGDSGAIYAGRSWSHRGNRIRYNFIHDCYSDLSDSAHAIYLDDCFSGTTIFGNVICRVERFALLNCGGRDNIWENNVVALCGRFHFSDGRGDANLTNLPGDSWNLLEKIQALNYRQPPWSEAYPALAEIPDDWASLTNQNFQYPGGTVFSRNVGWSNSLPYVEYDNAFSYYAEMTNNLNGENPLFTDLAGSDLTFLPDSPALDIPGFQPIPFHDIGITSTFEAWQLQYFGCTDCPEAAADADALGKGIGNYQQFLAGLNPTNPQSIFRIVDARPAPEDRFQLTWSSIGGRRYRVQYSDDGPGGFTDLDRSLDDETDPGALGRAGTMEFVDDYSATGPPPNSRRYYRIRLVPFYDSSIPSTFEEWQLHYFGCTNCPEAAAAADPLGKGISNYGQFLAGLDPTDPQSLFLIVCARPVPEGGFKVAWSSIGGRRYRVQYSDEEPGGFEDLVRSLNVETDSGSFGRPGIMEFIDDLSATGPPPNNRRFYRIRLY